MLLYQALRTNRWTMLATAAITATLLGSAVTSFADDIPAPGIPAPQAPEVKPAAPRDIQEVMADFQSNAKDIAAATADKSTLSDPAKRAEAAPTLVPLLQKQSVIFDEMMKQPRLPAAQIAPMKLRTQAELYLLNDKETVASVDAMSASEKKSDVQTSKEIKLLSQWIAAGSDGAAQTKVADDLIKMDEASPTDSKLTSLTYSFSRETQDKGLSEKLATAATSMKTPMARALVAQADAAKKLASLEGKPLVVAGTTPEGKDFSTADWKGKVILVDFWATWCGPCKAELPRVKKMYSDYHDKGLEILSVSNDYKASTLTDFTAKNGMPWPELYDDAAGSQGKWNPITLGYGINGIPTMFLIDKKGVCRTVEAREKMEDMIPTLLAE